MCVQVCVCVCVCGVCLVQWCCGAVHMVCTWTIFISVALHLQRSNTHHVHMDAGAGHGHVCGAKEFSVAVWFRLDLCVFFGIRRHGGLHW